MGYKLLIFPTPLTSSCSFKYDPEMGVVRVAKPDIHHTGRPGQSFEFPDGLANGNGGRLIVAAAGYVLLNQRGILLFKDGTIDFPWDTDQTAAFVADDFVLQFEKICPEIPPTPVPIPIPTIGKPKTSSQFKDWFFKQVENKPFGQQTLLDLEPALISVGSALTPPNAVGDRTKIQDPFAKSVWIRVGFGEGHWVWLPQS